VQEGAVLLPVLRKCFISLEGEARARDVWACLRTVDKKWTGTRSIFHCPVGINVHCDRFPSVWMWLPHLYAFCSQSEESVDKLSREVTSADVTVDFVLAEWLACQIDQGMEALRSLFKRLPEINPGAFSTSPDARNLHAASDLCPLHINFSNALPFYRAAVRLVCLSLCLSVCLSVCTAFPHFCMRTKWLFI
jgi:hypothetical protein